MTRAALLELSKDELVALILAQAAQIEALMRRVAALEATLNEPPKTPDNSSKPPSQGQKADRRRPSQEERRQGRLGVARALHPNPDRVVDAVVSQCPHCQADLALSAQTPQQVYDRIELPPSQPDVTRVRLHGGRCAGCGERFVAEAPPGLEPGSPFGKSIEALVVYLHYTHAIGLERLAALMGEVFGLAISEGAISNILARARAPLGAAADAIAERVKASRVVGSDETSARVDGQTWWEWVFVTSVAVLHIIRPSRGKAVPGDLFGDIRPPVWVSDMLGSQRGHGQAWQVCLAHLLRDAQYVVDCGDMGFGTAFRRLLLRAIAIGRRRADLKDTTLRQYRADLDRRLTRILALAPTSAPGRRLRKRIARFRDHFFVFVTERDVPYTNNASERSLRPSVVFRKVTNGFRSEWGAQTYAAFRSVVSTAKAQGRSVLDAVRAALTQPSYLSARTPG